MPTRSRPPGSSRGPPAPMTSPRFDALRTGSVTAVVRGDNAPSQKLAAALTFAYERDVEHFRRPHRLYRRRAG